MVDRILVPLDGSDRAEEILSQVSRLLRREDAEVILSRVVDVPHSLARVDVGALRAEEHAKSETYLREVARRLSDQGCRVRTRVDEGPVAETLLRAADREEATLIAMSTHGRSGLARWYMGSVAEKLIRASELPVLLARSFGPEGKPAGKGEVPFRRILVPVDGSGCSLAVVPAVKRFAALFEAEVLVIAVEEPVPEEVSLALAGSPPPQAAAGVSREKAAEIAAAAAREFESEGLKIRWDTYHGDVASRILDASGLEKADLIAMATHGRTGMSRWRLGSITEKVLRASPLPMLVVRSSGAP